MKKIFMGSAALLMFSISIAIFQLSCKKEVYAQTLNNGTNKILFSRSTIGVFNGTSEIWIANNDGSSATQIPLNVPGWRINNLHLSPDGSKIYFNGTDSTTITTVPISEIFSANVDGTNVQRLTNYNSSGQSTGLWDVN